MISETEKERLLQPGNFGLRIVVEMQKAMAAAAGNRATYDHASLLVELGQMTEDDREDSLAAIQALDRIVSALIVERGGYVPERCVGASG